MGGGIIVSFKAGQKMHIMHVILATITVSDAHKGAYGLKDDNMRLPRLCDSAASTPGCGRRDGRSRGRSSESPPGSDTSAESGQHSDR